MDMEIKMNWSKDALKKEKYIIFDALMEAIIQNPPPKSQFPHITISHLMELIDDFFIKATILDQMMKKEQ